MEADHFLTTAYPLKYHESPTKMTASLVERGRKFISLMGIVHCEFKGLAFYKVKGKAQKINLKGRTIIDAASFMEFNANYADLDTDPQDPEFFARRYEERRRLVSEQTSKMKALQPEEVSDSEAYLCGPTVQGFSLSKRIWGKIQTSYVKLAGADNKIIAEFTVVGISDITWNDVPFDALVLSAAKKDLLQALVQQTTAEAPNVSLPFHFATC